MFVFFASSFGNWFTDICCDSLYWNLHEFTALWTLYCRALLLFAAFPKLLHNGIGRYLQHFGRFAAFICHNFGKSYIGLSFKFAVICKNWVTLGHSYIGISLIFAAFETWNDIFALGLVHALQKYPREKARTIPRWNVPTRSCTFTKQNHQEWHQKMH